MKNKSVIEKNWKVILAEIFSWAFFPPLVATVFFTFLVFWYSEDLSQGLQWLVTVSPFLIFFPLIFFAASLKLGWISDIDLSDRRERPYFLSVFLISLAAAIILLYFLDVPQKFLAYAVSGFVITIIAAVITLFWKISFHTAITSSVFAAIVILGGTRFLPLLLLIIPIGWSRLVLKKHTFWQVVGGTLLAFLVTGTVFYLFGFSTLTV